MRSMHTRSTWKKQRILSTLFCRPAYLQLFDASTRGNETYKRRLLISAIASIQPHNSFKVIVVGHIRGPNNHADGPEELNQKDVPGKFELYRNN